MISELFTKSNAVISAVALNFLVATGSAHAAQKAVTFDQYCSAQQSGNAAEVHKNMHPFRDPNVRVTLQSTKHGPITMPFNCGSIIPYCEERKFAFTGDSISIIHAGLAGYNRNDPESARKVMARLAGDFDVYESQNLDAVSGENHLHEVHGMNISDLVNGEPVRAQNGTIIAGACAARLNR